MRTHYINSFVGDFPEIGISSVTSMRGNVLVDVKDFSKFSYSYKYILTDR